ncbi:response regulator transcription factor [Streptomyces sp. NPDC005576]|uniref:helix-turn-helix transcriptional regulator n=1 Tax=unclassified Streptomyces TaxID=2593676 RepID=UPI0033D59CBE
MIGHRSSRTTQIVVLAEDTLAAQGIEAYLAADDRVLVLPSDTEERPDVVLVITGELTDKTIASLLRFTQEDPEDSPRLIVVANKPTVSQLLRVIGMGLVAYMPRERTTLEDVTQMLCAVTHGAASLPPSLLGSLLEELRSRRWHTGQADESPAFTAREVDVLRQLAAGLNTAEIATALHHSERTVKYIIHRMTERHGLRNRVHVVAYALRQGVL